MKKKNIFVGIGCIILMAVALSFNVSQSNNNSDISLLSLKAMTNAVAECGNSTQGYDCYAYDNGTSDCMHNGSVEDYC